MTAVKILVVDDDKKILDLIALTLSQKGYQVMTAQNGAEAIQKSQTQIPDFIVADLMLPDMNGAEVVKIICEKNKSKRLAAIFLTGMITKEEEKENEVAIHVSNVWYRTLAKPFEQDKLLGLINLWLKTRQA